MTTKGISRETDGLTTGHDCAVNTTLDTPGQSTVFAEGKLVARLGDNTIAHGIAAPACGDHVASIVGSAPNVYVAGAKVARIGDGADAGSLTGGAIKVLAGNA
jgi:uncharacterized Zn-binding protein involved in type VI secretion